MTQSSMRLAEIKREIARTLHDDDGIGASMSADGAYVWVADEQCSWWHPAEAFLARLRELPDGRAARDEKDAAMLYGEWCTATETVGFFRHNSAEDTMPTPSDFRE